jgi:glycosyltransferase involved in cell wall biosynthesis
MSQIKVSVCMAVYNGELYLDYQLQSILDQTQKVDEIIIVNDCSVDKSKEIIERFSSKLPIKYIENERNLGVIKSFEKALENISGDIIFLCDQDDYWVPEKVQKTILCYDEKHHAVLSSYDYMDSENNVTPNKNRFKGDLSLLNTVIKNPFIGCCLSFKKELVECILPIPDNVPMHDSWIGVQALIKSEVYYIPEPLLYYRRHATNVTGVRRPAHTIFFSRLNFIITIISRKLGLS